MRRLRYACDICDYSPAANNRKTHIANDVEGFPHHAFLKRRLRNNLPFYPATVKTASAYRHASADAETTKNPAS